MYCAILTLFPEMFSSPLQHGLLKIAQESGALQVWTVNFRDYSQSKHHQVDDYPYGGGAGMVLMAQPIFDAVADQILKIKISPKPEISSPAHIILLSPSGQLLTQEKAQKISKEEFIILICGHYEGVDERVKTNLVNVEISVGDYILSGGELAALVLLDSVTRLLPGVLGNVDSLNEESFVCGTTASPPNLLEYPQFTRPADFRGLKVPEILISGDHAKIAQWRDKMRIVQTAKKRPDLLKRR